MCQYSIILSYVRSLGFSLCSQAYLSHVSYRTLIRCSVEQTSLRPFIWSRYADWLLRDGLAYRYDPTATCRPPRERAALEWLSLDDGEPLLAPGVRVLALPSPGRCLLVLERVLCSGDFVVEHVYQLVFPGLKAVSCVLEAAADQLQEIQRPQVTH